MRIEGAITLTTVTLLGRHLTAENHGALLEAARHKSKAGVEMLVARLHPQPDVPSSVRKVPAPTSQAAAPPLISEVAETIAAPHATVHEPTTSPPIAIIRALAPERYTLQVTINAETRAKLRRAQDLLRHTNRRADEAAVRAMCVRETGEAWGLPTEARSARGGARSGLDQVALGRESDPLRG